MTEVVEESTYFLEALEFRFRHFQKYTIKSTWMFTFITCKGQKLLNSKSFLIADWLKFMVHSCSGLSGSYVLIHDALVKVKSKLCIWCSTKFYFFLKAASHFLFHKFYTILQIN